MPCGRIQKITEIELIPLKRELRIIKAVHIPLYIRFNTVDLIRSSFQKGKHQAITIKLL